MNSTIGIHDAVRIPNPDFGRDTILRGKDAIVWTSPGRCLFNEIWDKRLGFFNRTPRKKIWASSSATPTRSPVTKPPSNCFDDLKDLGYRHATLLVVDLDRRLAGAQTKETIIEDSQAQSSTSWTSTKTVC